MQYHKIPSVFKRDPRTEYKTFLFGKYTRKEFRQLKDSPWVGTEKIDGTNVRLYKSGRIAGRTHKATFNIVVLEKLEQYSAILQQSDLPEDTVLYGEGYGCDIRSGDHYIADGNDFVLFDVMIAGTFQLRNSVEEIAEKLGIKVAPILATHSLVTWVELISKGEYMDSLLHPGVKNEGVILKPQDESYNGKQQRIITKLKFKDFGL